MAKFNLNLHAEGNDLSEAIEDLNNLVVFLSAFKDEVESYMEEHGNSLFEKEIWDKISADVCRKSGTTIDMTTIQ
jgi:hypothetical protein